MRAKPSHVLYSLFAECTRCTLRSLFLVADLLHHLCMKSDTGESLTDDRLTLCRVACAAILMR